MKFDLVPILCHNTTTMTLVLGLDTSSSKAGIALLDGKYKLKQLDLWKKDKKKNHYENLLDFHIYVGRLMPVDLVVIEKVSKSRNLNTVRLLAYFEAACLLAAQKHNVEILHISPKTARKDGFGNGNLHKEAVYAMANKKYGPLLDYEKGGNDESDAICLARAGVKHLNG